MSNFMCQFCNKEKERIMQDSEETRFYFEGLDDKDEMCFQCYKHFLEKGIIVHV